MKPCLDFDDNDDEMEDGDGDGLLKPTLQLQSKELNSYSADNYNSNGDVDRGQRTKAVFSKRHGKAGIVKRYQGEDDGSDEEDQEFDNDESPTDNFMNQESNKANGLYGGINL